MTKNKEGVFITTNEQALFSQMQNLGYSHGLCMTALHILPQDRMAVSDMLAYTSEDEFIGEMARICEANGWNDIQ